MINKIIAWLALAFLAVANIGCADTAVDQALEEARVQFNKGNIKQIGG